MSRPYLEMDVMLRWNWMGGKALTKIKDDIYSECLELIAEAEDNYRCSENLFIPIITNNTWLDWDRNWQACVNKVFAKTHK